MTLYPHRSSPKGVLSGRRTINHPSGGYLHHQKTCAMERLTDRPVRPWREDESSGRSAQPFLSIWRCPRAEDVSAEDPATLGSKLLSAGTLHPRSTAFGTPPLWTLLKGHAGPRPPFRLAGRRWSRKLDGCTTGPGALRRYWGALSGLTLLATDYAPVRGFRSTPTLRSGAHHLDPSLIPPCQRGQRPPVRRYRCPQG